jgi:hypothetical protein
MNLKCTQEYIVEDSSAAPIISNTERCGIAADHTEMCQFDKNTSQGFRTVVSASRRYLFDIRKQLLHGKGNHRSLKEP